MTSDWDKAGLSQERLEVAAQIRRAYADADAGAGRTLLGHMVFGGREYPVYGESHGYGVTSPLVTTNGSVWPLLEACWPGATFRRSGGPG